MPSEEMIAVNASIVDLTEALAMTQTVVNRINATSTSTASLVTDMATTLANLSTLLTTTASTATIVPTLQRGESVTGAYYLADKYYWQPGIYTSITGGPAWSAGLPSAVSTFNVWDATDKRFYLALADSGASFLPLVGTYRFVHFAAPYGTSTAHAPSNLASVSSVVMAIRGKFSAASDYTDHGIGVKKAAWSNPPPTNADHAIIISRDATAWELGSADGTTYSVATGGTADTSFHNFKIIWNATDIRLYVDNVLTITKTTNRPTEPMAHAYAFSSTNTDPFHLVDWITYWE